MTGCPAPVDVQDFPSYIRCRLETPEPVDRAADDLDGSCPLGDVALNGQDVGITRPVDGDGVRDDRPATLPIPGYDSSADSPRATGDDRHVLRRSVHGSPPISAGSWRIALFDALSSPDPCDRDGNGVFPRHLEKMLAALIGHGYVLSN